LTGRWSGKGSISVAGQGAATIEALELVLGKAKVSLTSAEVKNLSAPSFKGAVRFDPLDANSLGALAALPAALKDFTLQGDLALSGTTAQIEASGALAPAWPGLLLKVGVKKAVVKSGPAGLAFDADLALLDAAIDKSPLLPDVTVGGKMDGRTRIWGSTALIHMDINLDAAAASVKYGALFAKPAGEKLALKAAAVLKDSKDLGISSADVAAEALDAKIKGAVSDLPGKTALNLSMDASRIDLALLGNHMAAAKAYGLSGQAAGPITIAGPLGALKTQGSLTLKNAGAKPSPGASVDGINGKIDFVQNPQPAAAPARLAKTTGKLEAATVTYPHYLGKKFQLAWNLTNAGADMGAANGTADFSAADGRIHDIPLASKINRLAGKDVAEITYRTMASHFKVKNGVLDTQNFTVDSGQLDIVAKGQVSLVTLQSDLVALFKLPPDVGEMLKKAGIFWQRDEQGRAYIEAKIKGPITDPQIDRKELLKKALENTIKSTLDQFLKPKAADPSAPASEQPAPASSQTDSQKDLEDAARKALKNIFKKK
jgi:hypothetical protein